MKKAVFRESDHTYWLGDKQLISVTQLMKKHGLSPDYSGIDAEVLSKKAERGILIHKEIEDYINTGVSGFTTELDDYTSLCDELNLKATNAEQIVNNDIIAGTVDFQGVREHPEIATKQVKVLADVKTGTTINKEACRWQLSLYERLIGEQFDEFYIFHLGKKSKAIQVERIPREEIDKLIECERNDELHFPQTLVLPQQNLIEDIKTTEQYIKIIEKMKKEAESKSESLKKQILDAMASQGIKSYETHDKSMKITYIEPSTRESIDSTKLKKEMPDLAKKYLKTSNVKASVRITLREVVV